ncbi:MULTISPECIES: TetR family transcriptional regulator [Streptomycetaceae]|uniref:TetR family transcriptional regulator n=1 Tax=Streptomycetaceae TaxID=2062 RepID=UPI0030099467
MAEPSRRGRKRAATQEALHRAAMRLFAERGFAETTVVDITEAVDVSARTFFRYFASKEDVLSHELRQLGPALAAEVVDRPADEAPLEAVLNALLSFGAGGRDVLVSLTALLPHSTVDTGGPVPPTLPSARVLAVFAEWEADLVKALLQRNGVDDPDDRQLLRAEVTARAALAGMRTAFSRFRDVTARGEAAEGTFKDLVTEAFAILRDGCGFPPA